MKDLIASTRQVFVEYSCCSLAVVAIDLARVLGKTTNKTTGSVEKLVFTPITGIHIKSLYLLSYQARHSLVGPTTHVQGCGVSMISLGWRSSVEGPAVRLIGPLSHVVPGRSGQSSDNKDKFLKKTAELYLVVAVRFAVRIRDLGALLVWWRIDIATEIHHGARGQYHGLEMVVLFLSSLYLHL
jgi:hypothetical protein